MCNDNLSWRTFKAKRERDVADLKVEMMSRLRRGGLERGGSSHGFIVRVTCYMPPPADAVRKRLGIG